jgi:hypothetical protein
MPDELTGASTDPSVNPAQSITTPSTTLSYSPMLTYPAPAAPDPTLVLGYEKRLSDLMSAKDKALASEQRAVQDRLRLQQEKDSLEAQHASMIAASTKSIQDALDRSREFEEKSRVALARAAKMEKLLAHPELAAYASLIPDTDDMAKLDQAIETLKATRERDIQAAIAAHAPTQQQPNPNSLLGSNFIPPAAPARPAAAPTGASAIDAISSKLQAAAAEAQLKRDNSIYERALQEVTLMAQAAQQQ